MTTDNFLLLMMIHKIKSIIYENSNFKRSFTLSSQLPQTPAVDFAVFTAFLSQYLYLPLYM